MSRIIGWFCFSKLSHTVTGFEIFKAKVIMESSERGVGFAPLDYFEKHNSIHAVIRPVAGALATPEGLSEHMSWLIETYGNAKYDWLAVGCTGIFNRIKWLWQVAGWWLKRRLKKDAVHCTEIWVRLLQHADYQVTRGMDAELSDPHKLLRALAGSTDFQVEYVSEVGKKELV
jgi:hypothetical protein